LGIEGTTEVVLPDSSPTYRPHSMSMHLSRRRINEADHFHIRLRYESNTTSGLLTVHEQPSVVLVIHMQNFVLFDGQFSRVYGVIIVEDFGDGCMLVLPSGKMSGDERNATEDRLRTCST